MTSHQLVIQNLPLAASIAQNISTRLPRHIDPQDLYQDACVGLIRAAARYDSERKVSFRTYARRPIGGAVIDGLRQADHLSRDQRKRLKAEGAEPAAEPVHVNESDDLPGVLLPPEHCAVAEERDRILGAAIRTLPVRLRIVLRAYYHGGQTMRKIGYLLGVNESRVSQIHKRALCLLRDHLAARGFSSCAPFTITDRPEVRR
jgi:RNA polymerase sigma factor for flagellar operon FliA